MPSGATWWATGRGAATAAWEVAVVTTASQVVLGRLFSTSAQVTLVTVWQCSTSTGTILTLGLSTQCSVVTSRQACFTVATAEGATAWATGATWAMGAAWATAA